MIAKRNSERNWRKAVFGWIFGILGVFAMIAAPVMSTATVWAEPETSETTTTTETATPVAGKTCESSLGALGWLVCPATGKISEAVDWLYDKIEDILVINPVEMNDSSPIYQIWKYFQGVTNVIFVIFLLVVIYSQLTGVGITNYGIKKVLPKLIVVAVLVNLSFVMCSVLVDASNIIGNGLRGMFENIETATVANSEITGVTMGGTYASIAGGTTLAVGAGVIAFETGAIWMLIPVALGAIVAVASGLITIALRQAVVVMLIMVSPLAMVAYMLPNTEDLFKKWKKLLTKMLVFYPMFSLLFGASSLAGFALIASATDGFGLILGIAVQIFPLFFSWSLMRMSGTFLESINAKLRTIGNKPVAGVRGWAESHREATRMKYLASQNAYTPSLRLRQFISNRRVAREEDTKQNSELVKNRGLSYSVMKRYKDFDKGILNAEGESEYADQARNLEYQRTVARHKNNMNEGYAAYVRPGTAQHARLSALDTANVNASDLLKAEKAREEMIEYRNAVGYHTRMEAAINAHMDDKNGYVYDQESGEYKKRDSYEFHFDKNSAAYQEAIARYNNVAKVMNGSDLDAQYAAAYASHAYDAQAKIITGKFQKYFELTPPTRDVRYRLEEFSRFQKQLEDGTFTGKAVDNIDTIISGLRILNQRGDTDFVKDILDDVLDPQYGGLTLGTHASQAVASFLMFDVKDNDPYLRRFGKYINLETARVYDRNQRQKTTVDYEEYVKGYHEEPDGTRMYAKKDIVKLMEGTSLDGIERTALDNYDKSLRKAYTDENGVLDLEAYEKRRKEVDGATAPQFISANLKYLSGSEQIVSAVKSKTGFAAKQNKETGEYSMVPVWVDEADELFGAYGTEEEKKKAANGLEKWYRDQTLQYLKDQTPAQILGLRSDYKEPLLEHLSKAYLEDPERAAEHEAKISEIQSKYGDLEPAEAEKLRKRDRGELRKSEAGEAFRELLHSKGKLEQIERSKRSGAANNAKDWVRELLLLDSGSDLQAWLLRHRDQGGSPKKPSGSDDGGTPTPPSDGPEGGVTPPASPAGPDDQPKGPVTPMNPNLTPEAVQKKMAEKQAANEKKQKLQEQIRQMIAELEEQQKREGDANLTPEPQNLSVYDEDDIAAFQAEIERIWYDVRGGDNEYEEFYNASYDYIVQLLTAENYVVKMYEKYYQENPDGDSYDLREKLKELLVALLDE